MKPSQRLTRLWSRYVGATAMLTGLVAFVPTAQAQDAAPKTFSERAKEYWNAVVTKLESGAKATGDEYHKLKTEAMQASGPAREKLSAKMEVLSQKWAAARVKLSESYEKHMHSAAEELKTLEAKAAKATGPAREKLDAEMVKVKEEWHAAREKISKAYASNMSAAAEEYKHLKEEASQSSAAAKEKLKPRMERLHAEWVKNREKLLDFIDSDVKRTKEDLDKLGNATSETARMAKEKLMKKYHELRAQSEALAKERALEESK